ncbi:hypothetical protein BESB_083740 [Besnoitia besnoiti]|uniref:UNC-50 family protein n=1 Tax=Besnoitia besnoiti TaxID=94643 RepID=A0A2A9M5D2_BESBE|nr:hypothetical protein BESB_083740 [Besnoitia besnoiti]PFH33175.1 hypothetical protein BESB_083740 [Besnoitia besnoiti]
MLPTYLRGGCPCFPSLNPPATFTSFLANFCHRLAHLSLMDLQLSAAQFSLLLCAPRKVYEFASIRKKQKNYYARDDPGFLLLLFSFSLATGIVYALAFSHSALGGVFTAFAPPVYLLLSALVIPPSHYLFLLCRRRSSDSPASRSSPPGSSASSARSRERRSLSSSPACACPEFLFCFDVHWNASFLYLVFGLVLYFVLFPLIRLLPSSLDCFFSNAIQVAAVAAYCYITALGFASLGFSDSPVPFSLPALVFFVFALVATASSVNLGEAVIRVLLYFQGHAIVPTAQRAEMTAFAVGDFSISTVPPAAS